MNPDQILSLHTAYLELGRRINGFFLERSPSSDFLYRDFMIDAESHNVVIRFWDQRGFVPDVGFATFSIEEVSKWIMDNFDPIESLWN